MEKQIDFREFCDAFIEMGHEDHFSQEGFQALYDYLEDLYEGIPESYSLDVIELCSDYRELDLEELREEYEADEMLNCFEEGQDDLEDWKDSLEAHTTVIPVYFTNIAKKKILSSLIVQAF